MVMLQKSFRTSIAFYYQSNLGVYDRISENALWSLKYDIDGNVLVTYNCQKIFLFLKLLEHSLAKSNKL